MLKLAALLIIVLGLAHSILGERYILVRLFRKPDLPKLFGSTAFTTQTLRFAWHITTVAWFGLAALLVSASQGMLDAPSAVRIIGCTAITSGFLPLILTRGKHLSWLVLFAIGGLALMHNASAAGTPQQPAGTSVSTPIAPGYSREVPLWPEDSKVLQDGIRELADEKWPITHPSFLLYSPKGKSARSAVLVFAGGGYKGLALGPKSTIGLNGADVCKWMTDAGVTCVVVKYRVPNTGCNWNAETRRHETPRIPMALQDAQRALSIVRHNANEYGIDPDRIGVMGFSAGGNMAVLSSTAFRTRSYDPIDEFDRVSIRPDFAIPVYPGHMTMEHKNKTPKAIAAQELNTDIAISAQIPPTLLIHAKDDLVDPVHFSLVYERELKKAGVDVELILYATGGHAFGVRKQGKDTDRWTADALRWLGKIGML